MKSPDSFLFQVSYKLADVPFRAMKSLSKAVIKSVSPDAKIHKVSLHEGSLGLMHLLYFWAKELLLCFMFGLLNQKALKNSKFI
jgi:hypothetical protein